jgi:hypothetical protein
MGVINSKFIAAVCLAVVGLTLSDSRVFAHANPHVLDIVFRENGYVLLSNRGLIFGDKQRTNWRLMCAEALGINTSEVPSLVGLPDGRLMVATSQGLSATADDGCTWQAVAPFGDISTPAMAQDPTDSKRIYLAAYTPDTEMGGVYVSEDGGTNWQKLLAAGERDYVRSIEVAPSDPKHIYATGQTWDEMGKYTYYVTQSRDSGKTWQRQDVPLEKNELDLQLFAVNPVDPQVIAVHAGGSSPMSTPERLLVSRDGGKTFSSPLSMLLLSEVAFSADGSKAWVVGLDGFFESTDGLMTFQRVGEAESMSYVTEREGDVLACGYYDGFSNGASVNGVGMAKMPRDGFASFMQLNEVMQPVQCDPTSMTGMKCASWWLDWQRELTSGQFSSDGGVVVAAGTGGVVAGASGLDAGVAGAAGLPPTAAAGAGGASGAGVDAGVTPPPSGDGGCSVAAAGAGRGNLAVLTAFGACALALTRRRKAR